MYDLECVEIWERFAHTDQFRYCRTCSFNRARQLSIWVMWMRPAVGLGVGIEDDEFSESWTLGHKS